jgi:hypothetical protein
MTEAHKLLHDFGNNNLTVTDIFLGMK